LPSAVTLFPYTTLFRSLRQGGSRLIDTLAQVWIGTGLVAPGHRHHIVVGRGGARLEVAIVRERLRHQRGAEDLAIALDQAAIGRSEEHTSELQSRENIV